MHTVTRVADGSAQHSTVIAQFLREVILKIYAAHNPQIALTAKNCYGLAVEPLRYVFCDNTSEISCIFYNSGIF